MDNSMCIVMRTADYRDSDKMLTLFSRDAGRVSALARGAKNLKNPIAAASQPFCCGIFSFTGKNGKLYVNQCEIKKEFYNIGSDFGKFAAGCAMMEAAEKILENTVEYDRLFLLLVNCLYALEKGLPAKTAAAYFFVQVSDLLGICPSTAACAVCGRKVDEPRLFCAQEGGVVCEECSSGLKVRKVRPELMQTIEKMLATDLKMIRKIESSDPEVLPVMREYLDLFGELHLKSANYL
jgi:DNA repair protein RecO (recombination protein O)